MGLVHGQLPDVLTTRTAGAVHPERPSQSARGVLAVGATAAVATLLVALRDPHVPGSYGFCPLFALTGLYCPACGALRATHDLAHLDLAAAWASNPLWVASVPLLVIGWVVALVRRLRGAPARELPVWLGWAALALIVVFGVLRNLPGFAWLAP